MSLQLALAQDESGQNQADGGRDVVVLHSYLLPPAWAQQIRQASAKRSVRVQFLSAESTAEDDLQATVKDADLVLLDVAHQSVFESVAGNAMKALKESQRAYVLINDLDSIRRGLADPNSVPVLFGNVEKQWAKRVQQYYRYGGTENLNHLVEALAGEPSEQQARALAQPVVIPESGFYHPAWQRIESELSEVERRLAADTKPVVAIAINVATISACETRWLDGLIESLEERGLSSYAFYGPRKDPDRFTRMTCRTVDSELVPIADLMINSVLVFRPQDRKRELDQIGLPVLQILPARSRDAEQWRQSADGLPLGDISYYYASIEIAGMIDPVLAIARDSATQSLAPIPLQMAGIADRAAAILRLQNTPPGKRRVALFVYNYPPGENNFGASFLNVPKSLENVFGALSGAGYVTETPDAESITGQLQRCLQGLYWPGKLQQLRQANQADFVSLAEYEDWFKQIPQLTRQRIIDYWGPPESMSVTVDEPSNRQGFLIPRVPLGNLVVLPQPLRHELTTSTEADVRKQRIQHRSVVPLSHKYLATYLYIKRNFNAHAVIHFGTHGTQEWAPGKQRALAMSDEAMLAIGSLPNIYPYIMDNLGEATTAKRRGRASMISHLTPMFSPSGFRPGLHDMHVIMHDWETVDPGPVKKETERQLIQEFVKHTLDKDLGWSPQRIADNFAGFMEVLHPYLDDVAQSAQPQGLAVFGDVPSEERRFGMVMQMLRKRLIDALGEDIDEVFLIDGDKVKNSRPARWLRLALQDAEAASQIDLRKIDQLDTGNQTSVPNRAKDKQLDPQELFVLAKEAQRLSELLSSNAEMEALLVALDGKHLATGYGGDPVRNPESLPTGRNLYGFDPSRVPTAQSWKIGVGVLDQWIESYQAEHEGNFPTQIAFTLWAGETMRHHGVMEAQIFYALGVTPQWDSSGRMKGFEVIPAKEMGRPRIDVLANVTGSYRDQFPHLMKWIDEAVIAVSEIESDSGAQPVGSAHRNYVAQHAAEFADELVAQGMEPDMARRRATARVFSSESGTYGTGLNQAVYHSDLWKTQQRGGGDSEMSELFLHRMGHAYGEGLDGVAARDLFARQVKQLDVVFLARSSNTYGVLTSDDPFAYLGGFALASRQIGGKTPDLVVQNLRDPSEVIIDPVETAIAKEMQTRYLHPQWIQAQKQEGYSGTLQVLKATQFLWGWQAMSPGSVREDQWQSMMDVYIDDQYELGTRSWFEESNQQALAQMTERMLDAIRLNYWSPSLETQQRIARIYRESSEASGLMERNQRVVSFVSETFPDLKAPTVVESAEADASMNAQSATPSQSPTQQNDATSTEPTETQSVQGLELKPQQSPPVKEVQQGEPVDRFGLFAVLGMLVVVAIGAVRRLMLSSARRPKDA